MGGEPWLISRRFEQVWAAPLEGCSLGADAVVPVTQPRWANAAAAYLDIDPSGVLRVGKPGEEPVVVDSAVTEARWSPTRPVAWYTRERVAGVARRELLVIDLGASVDVHAEPVFVSEVDLDPAWSPDAAWLFFVTVSSEQVDANGTSHVISGLPGRADVTSTLPVTALGAFSPDGSLWAALELAYDEAGRSTGHGYEIHVAETSAGGMSWRVFDLGITTPGADGVRWIDEQSFAVALTTPGTSTGVGVVRRDGVAWRFEEHPLPGGASFGRLIVPSLDPCQAIPLRRRVRLPGCAAPWR